MSACVQGGVCASLLASLGVVTHTMVMREGVAGSAVISVKLIPQPVTGLSAIVIHPNADTHTRTLEPLSRMYRVDATGGGSSLSHSPSVSHTRTNTQTLLHTRMIKQELKGKSDHTGCRRFMTDIL